MKMAQKRTRTGRRNGAQDNQLRLPHFGASRSSNALCAANDLSDILPEVTSGARSGQTEGVWFLAGKKV
jgi:hypothetical protein